MNSVSITDIGRARSINQDSIYAIDTPIGNLLNVYILADGMGGEKAGDYASCKTIEYIREYLETSDDKPIIAVRNAIKYANNKIYKQSVNIEQFHGMGSTVVIATIISSMLYVFNLGDSRLYLIRDGIRQITKDHSYVEEMLSRGEITRDSDAYINNKQYITRAVGVDEYVDIDCFEMEVQSEDKILICSDGLSNMLDDQHIYQVVKGNHSIDKAARELIKEANMQGGLDNISVILIHVDEKGVSAWAQKSVLSYKTGMK